MSTSRTLFGMVKKSDYFITKPCGFQLSTSMGTFEPDINQPLAKGAQIIAEHYRNKYGVNINIIDHSSTVDTGANLYKRFKQFFADILPTLTLVNNNSVGFILMHETHHAVPLIITRENDINYIIIFDSNSGARKKGYISMANLAPNYKLLLNDHTRQADHGSCVTDALSILKDALRLENLATNIEAYKLVSIDTLTPSPERISGITSEKLRQPNLSLFNMPEPLLKTAQISKYITDSDANLDAVIRPPHKPATDQQGRVKPQTLSERRTSDELTVSFNKKPEELVGINSYLFNKSKKHAAIITAKIEVLNNGR